MTTSTIQRVGRLFGRKKKTIDLSTATQWQLIGLKMRQHKLAWYSLWFLVIVYFIALFAEFFAPFQPSDNWRRYTYAPPQAVSLFEQTDAGWRWAPHLDLYTSKTDPRSLKRYYDLNPDKKPIFLSSEKQKAMSYWDLSHSATNSLFLKILNCRSSS
ncbi:Oligopeptide transport system permease protein appC [Vibrio mimicus]|uniref:Oligopeptide transport system permease protein appC n=1 Tax=Vibrio mimicus TaxID=674 RepID=UPI0001B65720|nr:Oligopeptide transport system permease protein appC [Vibrio mimicus]EEW09224.1 Oligopeptide transport system permease protein appC [Vibrio mimicus VM573]